MLGHLDAGKRMPHSKLAAAPGGCEDKGGQARYGPNRDSLRDRLASDGVKPARQVAIDEVWPARRFRQAS